MDSFHNDEFVHNLRTSHQSIVDLLERTQSVARSYGVAKSNIRALSETLLNHFGRQDAVLFDCLRAFYAVDRQSMKTIESLVHDLKDIKIKFLMFFDKYPGDMGDLGKNSFPRDLMEFSSQVLGRIKIEEEYLFPLIEKYHP